MLATRTIPLQQTGGFEIPCPPFVSAECSRHAEVCASSVADEYHYPRDCVENVRSVLDIGSNLGAFVRFAFTWWPGKLDTITCYEPNPWARAISLRNVRGLPGVTVHPYAVTSDETAQFTLHENWGGSGTHAGHEGSPVTHVFPVPTIHPADLPQADVVKVDAEGVELDVLTGYRYLRDARVVLFEQHGPRDRAALIALMKHAGLVQARGMQGDAQEWDTMVWVRP